MLGEAGANTLSLATAHCSRRRPPVYGYVRTQAAEPPGNAPADAPRAGLSETAIHGWPAVDDGLQFSLLSRGGTYEETLARWEDCTGSGKL